jgi:transcriptional regulator with XRE-family HTH domain
MILSTVADELKALRSSIGVSQSTLARLSGVRRWKINAFELGGGKLSADELRKLDDALEAPAGAYSQPHRGGRRHHEELYYERLSGLT